MRHSRRVSGGISGGAGASYPQVAPGRSITAPPTTGWTTDPGITYSGAPCDAADALDGTGYIGLRDPSPAAVNQITARHRAIAAGATVTARLSCAVDSSAGDGRVGLYIEGPTGVAHITPWGVGASGNLTIVTYPVGYGGFIAQDWASPPPPTPWLRWDPAVGVEASPDGIAWVTVHAAALVTGAIGVPTKAGIVVFTGTTACSVVLTSWEVA